MQTTPAATLVVSRARAGALRMPTAVALRSDVASLSRSMRRSQQVERALLAREHELDAQLSHIVRAWGLVPVGDRVVARQVRAQLHEQMRTQLERRAQLRERLWQLRERRLSYLYHVFGPLLLHEITGEHLDANELGTAHERWHALARVVPTDWQQTLAMLEIDFARNVGPRLEATALGYRIDEAASLEQVAMLIGQILRRERQEQLLGMDRLLAEMVGEPPSLPAQRRLELVALWLDAQ